VNPLLDALHEGAHEIVCLQVAKFDEACDEQRMCIGPRPTLVSGSFVD